MARASKEEAKRLARLSSDCSFLLSHLIRQNDGRSGGEARKNLRSILGLRGHKPPTLKASPVGWYAALSPFIYDPQTAKLDGKKKVEAVCFTESTLAGLRAHRDVFSVKYGLAFDRDHLFLQGANPCLNIREDLLKSKVWMKGEQYSKHLYNFIPSKLLAFINVISESFDATHEREWRYKNDLSFEIKDVQFIFCPEEDFRFFSPVQKRGLPVLFDLKWLDRI